MSIEATSLGTPPPKTNGLAITSLVLGILALLACIAGVLFAIPGLICGIVGLKRVKNSGGAEQGHGLAVTGIVLNGVALALCPILALLAAIAVPNFVKARNASASNACVANLKTIDGAKATWALENRKQQSETPTDADLFGPTSYIREKPACPANGLYTINPVDSKPTCTVRGHRF